MRTRHLAKQKFHEQTDIFSIEAILKNDRLVITLKDFIERAVYERAYTHDDVGREIHKKADLTDVFASFIHINKSGEKAHFDGAHGLIHYKFG